MGAGRRRWNPKRSRDFQPFRGFPWSARDCPTSPSELAVSRQGALAGEDHAVCEDPSFEGFRIPLVHDLVQGSRGVPPHRRVLDSRRGSLHLYDDAVDLRGLGEEPYIEVSVPRLLLRFNPVLGGPEEQSDQECLIDALVLRYLQAERFLQDLVEIRGHAVGIARFHRLDEQFAQRLPEGRGQILHDLR